MNLEELRRVQRNERQTDSLQSLEDSFYRDAAAFIAERKAERDRAAERADDPFSSPEVSRLTDEIRTAEEVVESLYERRVGKVVKRATFAAADMSTDADDGLTAEERDLFEDLVDRIRENRRSVLDTLDPEADETPADDVASDVESNPDAARDPAPADTDVPPAADADPTSTADAETPPDPAPPDPDDLLAAAMGDESDGRPSADDPTPDGPPATDGGGGAAAPAAASAEGGAATVPDADDTAAADDGDATDRTTLRITQDVGEIYGVDTREYDLGREDVVTLPTPNAEPLLERGAAERLD